MPQPAVKYTIVTNEGDKNILARDYTDDYENIQAWAKVNVPFAVAFKDGDKGLKVSGIYEGHNREGRKIM